MFGSSRCQPLNIINLWRAVSVIHLLYNNSINIGVIANKNMFNNDVQTLSAYVLRKKLVEKENWYKDRENIEEEPYQREEEEIKKRAP